MAIHDSPPVDARPLSARRIPVIAAVAAYLGLTLCSVAHLLVRVGVVSASEAPAFWLNRGYGYWLTVSFVVLQIGLGRFVFSLPLIREAKTSGISAGLFYYAAGSYASYCALMGLAWFRGLNAVGMTAHGLAAVSLALIGLNAIRRTIQCRTFAQEPDTGRRNAKKWIPRIGVVLALLWIAPYFVQTLLPNTDWDSAMYHLPMAKMFLEQGAASTHPILPHYNFPGGPHLFYAMFLYLGAESAIIPFNFVTVLLIVLGVYALADRFWNRRAGLWAAAICASINILWELAADPRIDGFLAFYVLLACYAFLVWDRTPENHGWLIPVGLTLGMAMGIKYTAAVFAIVLVPAVLVLAWRRRKAGGPRMVAPLLLGMVLLMVPSGGWYLRNAWDLGDPVYPMLRGNVFRDRDGQIKPFRPAFQALLDKTMPPEGRQRILNQPMFDLDLRKQPSEKVRRHLFNLWDVFLHPLHYARKPFHWLSPFVVLFVLLPFFVRDRTSWWLFGIGCAAYAIIAAQTPLLRYAVPVFPLFSVGAALVIARVRIRMWGAVFGVLLAALLVRNTRAQWSKLDSIKARPLLAGQCDRLEWLSRVGYNWTPDMPVFIRFANRLINEGRIPRDTTLLMIGEGKGYLLECRYLPDLSRDGYPWLVELVNADANHEQIAQSLEQRGIEYILFNRKYFRWTLNHTVGDRESMMFGLYHLQSFLKRYAQVVYRRHGIYLAKLTGDRLPAKEPSRRTP